MESAQGWRCWDITEDGKLWSPLNLDQDFEWFEGRHLASCIVKPGEHDVPDPDCTCGFRVMTSLTAFLVKSSMVKVGNRMVKPVDMLGMYHPLWLPKVCGLATISGRIVGHDNDNDPAETLRGQWAEITGPLFLGLPFKSAAQLVANRYRVPVVVASVYQEAWITRDGLLRDWRSWQGNRDQLTDRIYRPYVKA